MKTSWENNGEPFIEIKLDKKFQQVAILTLETEYILKDFHISNSLFYLGIGTNSMFCKEFIWIQLKALLLQKLPYLLQASISQDKLQ